MYVFITTSLRINRCYKIAVKKVLDVQDEEALCQISQTLPSYHSWHEISSLVYIFARLSIVVQIRRNPFTDS